MSCFFSQMRGLGMCASLWYQHFNWSKMQHWVPQVYSNIAQDFHAGSWLWTEKMNVLKTALKRQCSIFTELTKKVNAAIEAYFKDILTRHKKPFTNCGMVKKAMTVMVEMLFRDLTQGKTKVMIAFVDVQLGDIVTRRVSALSANAMQ